MSERIYSIEDITLGCQLIGDQNELHNATFMAARGKLPIVPGMLVWTETASLASDVLTQPAYIQVYFWPASSSGRKIGIECFRWKDKGG